MLPSVQLDGPNDMERFQKKKLPIFATGYLFVQCHNQRCREPVVPQIELNYFWYHPPWQDMEIESQKGYIVTNVLSLNKLKVADHLQGYRDGLHCIPFTMSCCSVNMLISASSNKGGCLFGW